MSPIALTLTRSWHKKKAQWRAEGLEGHGACMEHAQHAFGRAQTAVSATSCRETPGVLGYLDGSGVESSAAADGATCGCQSVNPGRRARSGSLEARSVSPSACVMATRSASFVSRPSCAQRACAATRWVGVTGTTVTPKPGMAVSACRYSLNPVTCVGCSLRKRTAVRGVSPRVLCPLPAEQLCLLCLKLLACQVALFQEPG